MKTIITLMLITCLTASCKNNPSLKKDQLVSELTKVETIEETDKSTIDLPEFYTPPPGIQSESIIMVDASFKRLDMQEVLKNERPVKLSDFGKELVYHRITEPIMRIRNILSIPEGYLIAALTGSVYLYDKNFKMVKKLIEEDIEVMKMSNSYMYKNNHALINWCYDEHSGLLFSNVCKWLKEDGEFYIGTIPLNELLNLSEPITPDKLKNKIKTPGQLHFLPLKNGYASMRFFSNILYTFNSQGDTISVFNTMKDEALPKGTIQGILFFYKS